MSRFTRKERLKGRDEIRVVFNRGKVVSCRGAKLFILKNGLSGNRMVVTFARKFGNAVTRNRARRVSREAYRLLKRRLKTGFDLVMLVYPVVQKTAASRPGTAPVPLTPVTDCLAVRMEQLRDLFNRAGLFMEDGN